MTSVALVFIGFSILSALLLSITHFRQAVYVEQTGARVLGLLLMLALAGLQLAHWAWLYLDRPWIDTAAYRVLLFSVAPLFYGFSRPLLARTGGGQYRVRDLGHAVPAACAALLDGAIALPLAFVLGSGYLVLLARDVHRLRAQRQGYAREIALLGSTFVIALAVAVLGMLEPLLPHKSFHVLYGIAIGLAFLLVQTTLGARPRLPVEVAETARTAYATSTLSHVDVEASLTRLAALMAADRVYEDPDLGLASLANRLGLSSHQLSELLNTRLGKGFSRYLREVRVAAARQMLVAEPSASVLSVGLSVGFGTQSSFYDAFREIEGMTPGQFRRIRAGG